MAGTWRQGGVRTEPRAGAGVGVGMDEATEPTGAGTEAAGDYRVQDEVIASIASLAAAEVDGVAGLGGGLALGLGEVLGARQAGRGVRVEIGTREAAVDVYLQVEYGVRIPVVAQRVQEGVKRAVESMTGLRVVEVNVHVQGVDFSRAAGRRPGGARGDGAPS